SFRISSSPPPEPGTRHRPPVCPPSSKVARPPTRPGRPLNCANAQTLIPRMAVAINRIFTFLRSVHRTGHGECKKEQEHMNLPFSARGSECVRQPCRPLPEGLPFGEPPLSLLFPAFHRLPVQRFRRKLGELDTDAVGVRDVG